MVDQSDLMSQTGISRQFQAGYRTGLTLNQRMGIIDFVEAVT